MKNKPAVFLSLLLTAILACGIGNAPTSEPPTAVVVTEAALTQPQANPPTFTPIPTLTPEAPTVPAALSPGLAIQASALEEAGENPPYDITAQIPALQGSNDPRVQTFNALLNQIVQNQVDSFRSDVLAFAPNPPLTGGSSLDIQYSLVGQRGDIWSLKFDISFYSDGAAHPGHSSVTVNYDLASGREIYLDQLFFPGSPYLQVVSDYCKAELAARDIGFDGFSGGADPLPENFQRWNLSNEGLIVVFDEYQVAPYAAGPQVVTIPFAALQSVANPDGVLALFAQ